MNNESIASDPGPTGDFFDALGMSGASVEKFLHDRNRYDTSKHVCICGHAVNKHAIFDHDRISCHTARHYCPCREVLAVFCASDTRYFMRKTYGPGSKHALSAGLERLQSVGKTGYWLFQPRCWNQGCPNPEVAVFPVAITTRNQIAYEPAAINVFLCETCFVDLLGKPNQVGMGHIW